MLASDHHRSLAVIARDGEEYIARWVLALRLARQPCAMGKDDDVEHAGVRHSRLGQERASQLTLTARPLRTEAVAESRQ